MRLAAILLISGPAHLPYAVVSLRSLRRHWEHPIEVYAWPESFPIVQRIAEDENLGITAFEREPSYRGKNAQFLDKILLMQTIQADAALYLDADTLVRGRVHPLLAGALTTGFVATQFNDWAIGKGVIHNRIARLRQFPEIPQDVVEAVLANPKLCSVNGGVFACRPSSPVLPQWYKWANIAKSIFIADETVLHVLQIGMADEITIAGGGSWNCSPKHKPSGLADNDVRIWHGHGDCFTRPNKCKRGTEMWMKVFSEVVDNNIGGIRDWPSLYSGNKYLEQLLKDGVLCRNKA